MVIDFLVISELESIREKKRRLSERESELSLPKLQDISLIPALYEWFNEIQDNRDCPARRGCARLKKQFIFIVMFLYSPSTLAGGKIGNGIRDAISEVLEFKSPTGVSNLCVDVTFLYDTYPDFSRDIEYLYTEIVNRLKVKGLIK